jgi:C-terminal processing protease CtpA/Prc
MSGLALSRINGSTLVDSVAEGSPAATAGLRPQDAILRVGNEDAAAMRLHTVRLLLCSEGKKVDLTVRREGEETRVRRRRQPDLIMRRGDEELRVTLVLRNWRERQAAAK